MDDQRIEGVIMGDEGVKLSAEVGEERVYVACG